MPDQEPTAANPPEPDRAKANVVGGQVPVEKKKAALGSDAAEPLTAEEQMARFAKELKENDWGHQPC